MQMTTSFICVIVFHEFSNALSVKHETVHHFDGSCYSTSPECGYCLSNTRLTCDNAQQTHTHNDTVGAIFKKGIRVVQAVSSHTSSASSQLHQGPPLNLPPTGTGHLNPFHLSSGMNALTPQHNLSLQGSSPGQQQHPSLSAHHSLPPASSGNNNNNNPYRSSIGTLHSSRNYALSFLGSYFTDRAVTTNIPLLCVHALSR